MAKIFNFPPKMAKYLKNIFLNKKIFPLPLMMKVPSWASLARYEDEE